jgi:hypothetical protein
MRKKRRGLPGANSLQKQGKKHFVKAFGGKERTEIG